MKNNFENFYFSIICPENSSLVKNLTRTTGTLHEYKYTFLIIYRSILLKIRNVSGENGRENRTTFCFQ